jgi:hypothetical protein
MASQARMQQLLQEVSETFQRQVILTTRAQVVLGTRGSMEETVVQAPTEVPEAGEDEGGDGGGTEVLDAGEDEARARKGQNLWAMLGSLGCGEVLARSILHTAEGDTMTVLAQLSQVEIVELFQAAAVEMAARVGEGVEAWKAGTKDAKTANAASGKFFDGKYGKRELFDTGLEGYVGLPVVDVFEAMVREHASKTKFSPSNNPGTRPPPPSP